MTRVKSSSAKKHRKTLKSAKGYKNARSRRQKVASEAVLHAGKYAYIGRRLKRRDLRRLWITRISAAAKADGVSYSVFMKNLKKADIQLDRKILSDIAISDPETFKEIVKVSQK